ncbi:MAG: ribbon-helix-helix domain-containing protein [Gordonia sp. (in: high G+C Gram-positive bacteria)]|uniref:ribbon-helix-helix domain-containing protein n=1 Tax=Gordonia sp. (in: high G+C Gram-positive bacteria) TaxID=84139 RepID=UPI0039E4F6A6
MKLSVSLSESDLADLDRYVEEYSLPSRSAAVQRAIRLLGRSALRSEYDIAFTEWTTSGDDAAWDSTAADGLTDETW